MDVEERGEESLLGEWGESEEKEEFGGDAKRWASDERGGRRGDPPRGLAEGEGAERSRRHREKERIMR